MIVKNNRTLKFVFPLAAALLFAAVAAFMIAGSAHAASNVAKAHSVSLNQLTYRSFTLTDTNITINKTITGQLNTGGQNPQGWVDATYTVTEAQFRGFYGYDPTQYLVNSNYIIPVEVRVERITQYNSTDISLELGSPQPGSLNEGGGSTLAGNYQSNGSIIGRPNQYSPEDRWTATPLR